MVPWSLVTAWQKLKGAKQRARGQKLLCFSVCTHTFFSAVLNIVPLHPLVSLLWYHLVNASMTTLIWRPRWCCLRRCRHRCCSYCSPSLIFFHGWWNPFHQTSVLSTVSPFPSHIPNFWMTPLPQPGLLWHCEEPHGSVNYKTEAGYRTVPGTLAVRGWYLVDVQQCLAVQPQDIPGLQVLLEISWSVWVRDWSGHARSRILLWEEGKERT